jgi:hypothetical protein
MRRRGAIALMHSGQAYSLRDTFRLGASNKGFYWQNYCPNFQWSAWFQGDKLRPNLLQRLVARACFILVDTDIRPGVASILLVKWLSSMGQCPA